MDGEHGEYPHLIVRTLTRADLPRLVAMDEPSSGRRRSQWFEGKLDRALQDSSVCISLGAESDGLLVGALLGGLQFGEFGLPEPVAILDTILVDDDFRRQGVASAMLDQLQKNLAALRISNVRTEVAWDELDLLAFFGRRGFKPVPRLVLEWPIESA